MAAPDETSHWVRFLYREWYAGTRMLTPEQRAIYLDLLCLMYDRRTASLPPDLDRLRRWCGVDIRVMRRTLAALLDEGKLVETADGQIHNARAAVEIARAEARSDGAREAALARHRTVADDAGSTGLPANFPGTFGKSFGDLSEKSNEINGRPHAAADSRVDRGIETSDRSVLCSSVGPPQTDSSTHDRAEARPSIDRFMRDTGDPRTWLLWNTGVAVLAAMTGNKKATARQVIGRLVKDTGGDPGAVWELLLEAKRREVADPVAWMRAAIRQRGATYQRGGGLV